MDSDECVVTVLVCTCDRGALVAGTVKAILASAAPAFEVLVIDQSRDDASERALRPLCEADARARVIRLGARGKPLALNHGLALSRGRYIALTDDDCEPLAGWLDAIVGAFAADARVGCVFGDVDAPPHDITRGFIPVCRINASETVTRLSELLGMPGMKRFGIGANMAIRRDVLVALGGWDPWIGPGTKFGSGDDVDLAVRIVRAGHAIRFCPSARVLHYGFRASEDLGQNFARNGFGMGAIFAKHVKCGALYPGALRLFASRLRDAASNAVMLKRPIGASYPLGWLRGVRAGFRHPVDTKRAVFAGVPSGADAAHVARVAKVDAASVKRT